VSNVWFLWKQVCRTLGHDLSRQTSASRQMRGNYERILLVRSSQILPATSQDAIFYFY